MKRILKLGALAGTWSALVAFAVAAQPAVRPVVQPAIQPAIQPAVPPAQVRPGVMILVPSIAQRVAQSTTIIVGKVESIEEKPVEAKQSPAAKDKAEYQIAVIKVEDAVLGAKGLTHVRVGFGTPPPARPNPGGAAIQPIARPPIGANKPVNFVKDQEVLVFLNPHFDGNFLYPQAGYDVVEKQGNQNFEKDVEEAKKYVKMLANPKEALKAEKQDDRYAAAAVLVMHYRYKRIGADEPKTEAVDADVSKLILTALAEANWANGAVTPIPRMTPQILFNQLGVTDKDGWTPPMREVNGRKQVDYQKQPEAMKQWCKDNAEKYKIQRFAYDKAEKSEK